MGVRRLKALLNLRRQHGRRRGHEGGGGGRGTARRRALTRADLGRAVGRLVGAAGLAPVGLRHGAALVRVRG